MSPCEYPIGDEILYKRERTMTKGEKRMSVKEELDLTARIRMWSIYDKLGTEVCKVIMEQGELTFYFPEQG